MERCRSLGHFARALVLAVSLTAFAPPNAPAHDDDLGRSSPQSSPSSGDRTLDGTWRLIAPESGDGRGQYKTIGGGRFIWYAVVDGRIVDSAGGRMRHHDGHYIEWIDFSGTATFDWMVGGTGRFTVDLHDGRWRHRGTIDGPQAGTSARVDEVWERVLPGR